MVYPFVDELEGVVDVEGAYVYGGERREPDDESVVVDVVETDEAAEVLLATLIGV